MANKKTVNNKNAAATTAARPGRGRLFSIIFPILTDYEIEQREFPKNPTDTTKSHGIITQIVCVVEIFWARRPLIALGENRFGTRVREQAKWRKWSDGRPARPGPAEEASTPISLSSTAPPTPRS